MAYAERLPRTASPADVIRGIVEAVLPRDGSAGRGRADRARPHPGAGLDAGTLRDIGARREYQDYASSTAVTTGPDLRLHRIADTANSSSAGYGNWVGAPSPTGRRPTARSFT